VSVAGFDDRFRQHVKWLAESFAHRFILPNAVRQQEIEQATLFARFLLREQRLGVPRQFEPRDSLGKIGFVDASAPVGLALAALLRLAPLRQTGDGSAAILPGAEND
jgi:hypothetical protein